MSSTKSVPLILSFLLLAAASSPPPPPPVDPKSFLDCVSKISNSSVSPSTLYAPTINRTAFTNLLKSTAENLRFVGLTVSKPQFIFAPQNESHVQAAVVCSTIQKLNLRVRSGGHDYEGLSYVSYENNKPFFVIDLSNLRSITVSVDDRSAWAQSGATIGELYYAVSRKSATLAVPAGICTTIGVGGHVTGGGYGSLMRKFGLAVDNALDARMVDASGRVLDRSSMGEELFWAIRGGAGGSFGIIISWKLRLVEIPSRVTYFEVGRETTDVMRAWQRVADTIDENLFVRVIVAKSSSAVVSANYQGLFLGDPTCLLRLMGERFPELGLNKTHCSKMKWIESVMRMTGFNSTQSEKPGEYLPKAKPAFLNAFKAKSDYLKKEMSKEELDGMWKVIAEDEGGLSQVIFTPYGGEVNRVKVNATAFPHREVRCMVQYVAQWVDPRDQGRVEEWGRGLYNYMTPFVSKNPRETYANYRDFDIGFGEELGWNWSCPRVWGSKYFMSNFERLVKVKGEADPENVFNHELSIPTQSIIHQCTKLV